MKNIKISLILGALLGGIAASAPAMAADLLDVYRLAQQNDPEIAAAEANFFATRESSPQARSAYLPQIQGSGEYGRTESESSGEQFFAGQTFPDESVSETDAWQWSINLRQTLFNWATLKEMRQAEAEVARAEAEFRAAQQQLIVRVAESYFALLGALDSLEAASINQESIGRQLEQTRRRFDVGLIAITDVQESQAAFDQARAEVIAAERSVNSARENLRAIVGEYINQPARPGSALPLSEPRPNDAASWVDTAMEQNLNVIASRFALESAEEGVGLQRGGHYPTLDLVASHTEGSSEFTGTGMDDAGVRVPREGSRDETRDFIGVQLSVPIFSGGATRSRVRQAAHLASAARSNLKLAIRQTENQARDNFLGVISDISRVEALNQAYESASTALRATQAGYDVGTRTAVDVLTARRNELQALVNYQSARYDYILNSLRLKQAAGTLSEDDVAEIARWMEERSELQDLRETEESSD